MKQIELIDTRETAKMLGFTLGSFRVFYRKNKPFPQYRMNTTSRKYNKFDVLEYLESLKYNGTTN